MESQLLSSLVSFVVGTPSLIAWFVGAGMALQAWPQEPRRYGLVLGACAAAFAGFLIALAGNLWMVSRAASGEPMTTPYVWMAIRFLSQLFELGGWGLLLFVVFGKPKSVDQAPR